MVPSLTLAASLALAPNIIWLECDEMDGRVLDPTTSGTAAPYFDVAPMPNLHALMERGTTFTGHYATNPLCAPSRASTFTGRRTSSLEAWSNVKPLVVDVMDPTKADANCVQVPGYDEARCVEMGRRQRLVPNATINHLLANGGYDVRLYGKMDTGGGPSMMPPGTHASGFHMPGGQDWSGAWDAHHPELEYYPADILHSWANSANLSQPIFARLDAPNKWVDLESKRGCPSSNQDWKAVDDCATFLGKWRRGETPFFLYCSVVDPHPPYWSNASWMAGLNQTALNMTLRAAAWAPLAALHPHDLYQARAMGVPLDGPMAGGAGAEALRYSMGRAYAGQLVETDAMMGRVLRALAASEAAHTTYVLFTSDHGEARLEHRHLEKMSHYEASARVPLIVAGPDVPTKAVVHNLTSLLDLLPTFLDIAGLSKPPLLDGYTLAPFLRLRHGAREPRPSHVVAEYTGEATNTGSYMYREGRYKLIAFGRDPPYQHYEPLLFDVEADPMELTNLAARPEHAARAVAMDAALRAVVDYPAVNSRVIAEGRENARRWIALYPNASAWQKELRKAFGGPSPTAPFPDADVRRFERWLNATGEFAPVAAPRGSACVEC